MSGYPCCCGAKCYACKVTGEENAPAQFQVAIAGIVVDECADCDDLNDTYITTFTGTEYPHVCYWEYQLDNPICGMNLLTVRAWWSIPAGAYALNARLHDLWDFNFITWHKEYASRIDCMNLNGESLPFLNQIQVIDQCDGSAATCLITAI